jgi:4-carboxymuconolactone decarboxylase
MNRIKDVPPQERTPAQNDLHEKVTGARGMFFSPYKVWIHSPPIGFGMEAIGTHLNSKSCSLSPAEMELATLVTARFWNAAYVIKNHSQHAARAGLDAATIEVVTKGGTPPLANERLRAVYGFTSASLRGEALDDAGFARYEKELGRDGIADILGLIGYFTAVSLAMKTHDV